MEKIVSLALSLILCTNLMVGCKKDSSVSSSETTGDESTTVSTSDTTAENSENTTAEAEFKPYVVPGEENALKVYTYPTDNIFGLEKVVVFENEFEMVFLSDDWWLEEYSVEQWRPQVDQVDESSWKTQLETRDGRYIFHAVFNWSNEETSNLDMKEFSIYIDISGVAVIDIHSDYTRLYYNNPHIDDAWEVYEDIFDYQTGEWDRDHRLGSTEPIVNYGKGDIHVKLYAMSAEVPNMLGEFMSQHPDMKEKYTVDFMYCYNDNHGYEMKLNNALLAGEDTAPDIYVAEADYVLSYTQGEYAQYAAPYEDLIENFDEKLEHAELADYAVELGKNTDGKVMALGYQSTVGAFIYRRSIAKEVFGSDDQAAVEAAIGANTGNWDKFLETAEILKEKGYAIVSGIDGIYRVTNTASKTPWVVDGKFNIDPERETYIDIAEKCIQNGYTNDTTAWSSDWYGDMADEGERQVFGWFGPCWLINYVIASYVTESGSAWGDYAVCQPNIGFWWGGSWLFCNKNVIGTEKQEFCARFIEWITLDTSETGLQYGWANDIFSMCDANDTVLSKKVMEISDGSNDFLRGQDPFQVFVDAAAYTAATGVCEYDADLNSAFQENVALYAKGDIASKEDLMARIYDVCEEHGIEVE